MSTNALKAAVTGAVATKKPETIFDMFKVWQGEIARALPKHMTADRVVRIATTEIRKTPMLGECTPISLFGAVITSAQMGLEIGMGRVFLVPYRNRKKNIVECQLIPGWKGLVELANRSGRSSCWTGAVFQGDKFEYRLGDSPFVNHVPMGEDDPKRLTHVYAVGRVRGSEWPVIEVWPIQKVWKHRDRYNRQGTDHYSFREQEMYARKIPLLQVLKYLPASAELEAAMMLSNAENVGQGLTLEGVLSPEGVVTYSDPSEEGGNGDPAGSSDRLVTGIGPTYAEVREQIEKAKTREAVDTAESLVDTLPDQFHRELHELAKKRRAELSSGDVTY
jgi:recombination protein RecT